MTIREVQRALFRAGWKDGSSNEETRDWSVLIQLPDGEPPVSFTVEVFEDTVVLFPKPHLPGHVWRHETNVNESYDPLEEPLRKAVHAYEPEVAVDILRQARSQA